MEFDGQRIFTSDDVVGLQKLPRSLVIIGADHGEGFLDHGWRGHGPQLYEEAVRTPLVFRWKGHLAARESVRMPVGLIDIAPTVLGLLGIEIDPDSISGRDLGPLLRGADSQTEVHPQDHPIFFERVRYERAGRIDPIPLYEMNRVQFGSPLRVRGEKFGVRLGRWKYLEAADEARPRELYDLALDPRERLNLVSAEPANADRLSGILATWRREVEPGAKSVLLPLAEPDRKALEALGYTQPLKEPWVDPLGRDC